MIIDIRFNYYLKKYINIDNQKKERKKSWIIKRSVYWFSRNIKITHQNFLILEKNLPISQKSIKPSDIGGIAGGTKYIVCFNVWKFFNVTWKCNKTSSW